MQWQNTYNRQHDLVIVTEIEVDFEGNERDMTGDRVSDQEATSPEVGDPGMCMPRSRQSGQQ